MKKSILFCIIALLLIFGAWKAKKMTIGGQWCLWPCVHIFGDWRKVPLWPCPEGYPNCCDAGIEVIEEMAEPEYKRGDITEGGGIYIGDLAPGEGVGIEVTTSFDTGESSMVITSSVIHSYEYEEGFNDAIDCMTLLDLELDLKGQRATWGERADICRERFDINH